MHSGSTFWSKIFPNPRYYGWVVVGVGFLCSMLSSPGQSFALSLYLESLMVDLGVSRLELSSLYATATLLAAACLPVIGGWADRTTGRRFLGGVLVLMGVAFIFFSRVRGVYALGVAFFALRLLGQGAIGLGTLTEVVRWFRRYRGRALAVVSLGYAFGEIVFPGVILRLIGALGWRGSLLVFAGLYLAAFAPVVIWLSRERRGVDGAPDGEWVVGGGADGAEGAEGATPTAGAPGAVAGGARARSDGAQTAGGVGTSAGAGPGAGRGADPGAAAETATDGGARLPEEASFMVFAVCGVLMTYLTGLMLERVPSRVGVSFSLALMAVAFVVAGLVPLPAMAGALVYGGVLGLSNGAAKSANSMVWPSYFGIGALGAVKGVVSAVRNGATAIGPPLAALLIGDTGSFAPALVLFGVLSLGSAVVALFLREPAGMGMVGAVD